MTMITSEEDAFPLGGALNTVEAQLRDITSELSALQTRLREGDLGAVKDASKVSSELRQWLRIAFELEAGFEERKKRQSGVVRDYALDFEDARTKIGCRLDRLRKCGGATRLSG
ncbi:hypothetical protein [Thalassovita taeanensis]|uniref:Uncharacterized protein n=1 Tax=Thalassovita taeanensis TaxID=657014 RepID=A0A1H9HQM6_9RHOB|nr:hypothetical protein [Thalassovita taeanensis]SEQ64576.1 hypothetical protein SAMN04488092_11036 [Thalassovita taeanensis]